MVISSSNPIQSVQSIFSAKQVASSQTNLATSSHDKVEISDEGRSQLKAKEDFIREHPFYKFLAVGYDEAIDMLRTTAEKNKGNEALGASRGEYHMLYHKAKLDPNISEAKRSSILKQLEDDYIEVQKQFSINEGWGERTDEEIQDFRKQLRLLTNTENDFTKSLINTLNEKDYNKASYMLKQDEIRAMQTRIGQDPEEDEKIRRRIAELQKEMRKQNEEAEMMKATASAI